jgi:hypothetical protein
MTPPTPLTVARAGFAGKTASAAAATATATATAKVIRIYRKRIPSFCVQVIVIIALPQGDPGLFFGFLLKFDRLESDITDS